MANHETIPDRLGRLIESGGALEGFDWPDRIAQFDIMIDRDGTWFHEGRPINRKRLCRLFATILHRDEAGRYWLVTPGERGEIRVEDAPFVAVEVSVDGAGEAQTLRFRTNLDHWVTADRDHPIRVEDGRDGQPAPYIRFRDRLDAKIARSVFYELADMAVTEETADGLFYGVWSAGMFFPMGRAE